MEATSGDPAQWAVLTRLCTRLACRRRLHEVRGLPERFRLELAEVDDRLAAGVPTYPADASLLFSRWERIAAGRKLSRLGFTSMPTPPVVDHSRVLLAHGQLVGQRWHTPQTLDIEHLTRGALAVMSLGSLYDLLQPCGESAEVTVRFRRSWVERFDRFSYIYPDVNYSSSHLRKLGASPEARLVLAGVTPFRETAVMPLVTAMTFLAGDFPIDDVAYGMSIRPLGALGNTAAALGMPMVGDYRRGLPEPWRDPDVFLAGWQSAAAVAS